MKKIKIEKLVQVEVSLEDISDEDITAECERRDLMPGEKSLGEFDNEEIAAEYADRFGVHSSISATDVHEELYRTRQEAPQIVKDFLYQQTGRTLP